MERLTYDFEVADLAHHGHRVDLAHVVATVLLFYAAYVQQPGLLIVARDGVPRDFRHHVLVHGDDHLPADVDPHDLQQEGGESAESTTRIRRRGAVWLR